MSPTELNFNPVQYFVFLSFFDFHNLTSSNVDLEGVLARLFYLKTCFTISSVLVA